MNCPDCSWTAEHIHYSAPALTSSADVVERTAPHPDIPLRVGGTTLLGSIIDRLIDGDPVTVWHLTPSAPTSPG